MARYVIVNAQRTMVFNGFLYSRDFGPRPDWSQLDSTSCRCMIMYESGADKALADLKTLGTPYEFCEIVPVGEIFG